MIEKCKGSFEEPDKILHHYENWKCDFYPWDTMSHLCRIGLIHRTGCHIHYLPKCS